MHQSIRETIAEHLRVVEAVATLSNEIAGAADRMIECIGNGGKLCWCGNGGSAADSQHLAAEMVVRFERERRGLPAMAFNTDTSILTAVGNDLGFERIFARQVEALMRPDDLLVAISTSGTSSNILQAVRTANEKGIETLGLTGRDGGILLDLADHCLVVPSGNTARIQEAHILIGHILCDLVEAHFTPKADSPFEPPARAS
ncbi:MAG: D-sedoheptulose 7-phosphate isomerase [Pseudomonadota bacterium]|nr:D-sedoheptulose 7-phosphate isomerase [Pseudomonadota bacterium]